MIIEIFKVGSPVFLADNIPAMVVGVYIKENLHVQYQVAWWDGRARKVEYLEHFEVYKTKQTQSLKLGFV